MDSLGTCARPGPGRRMRWAGAAWLLLCLALPAQADVWGYVDEKGVAQFAAERVDERYELFFRNTETFDTSLDAPIPEPAPAADQPASPAPRPKASARAGRAVGSRVNAREPADWRSFPKDTPRLSQPPGL